MKYFQNIMANAITGAIIGNIFLLPYLGWPFSGHMMIERDWTERFLIAGTIWGSICGVVIGLVPLLQNSTITRRLMRGIIVGGLSGIVFYFIGDLAYPAEGSLLTTLSKSLWGFSFGIIGGGISALVLGILYWSLKWVKIRDDPNDQYDQDKKRQFKEKVLSGLIGLNTGSFTGNVVLLVVGQVRVTLYRIVYDWEILWMYLLPIIFGCLAAIYLYIKPLKKQSLQKIIDGLRNGIVFGVVAILYFSILTFMILLFHVPRPEFMSFDSLVGFFLTILGLFTLGFGIVNGLTRATLEEFFAEAKAKLKIAA